jgi:arsenite methyltransferase
VSQFDFLTFEADFSSPRFVAAYDELPLWSAMFGVLLFDELRFSGVATALDVGCGTGFPLIELAERLGPRAQVHGVDPWAAGLARAREKIDARQTPNITLHETSATAMPFSDATFDLIVSNLGLNNFDDPVGAIRECRRVTKPGAILALTTNLHGHMQEFYDIFEGVLQEAGDSAAVGLLDEHVRHRATVSAIRQLLHNGGFGVTRIVERVGRMRFADGQALFNHHFIKLGFLDAWKAVVRGRETETFARLLFQLDALARERGGVDLTIPMAYIEAAAT